MRNLSLYLLLVILAGCTTSGGSSMNAPGPSAASVTYASHNSSNTGVDVNAINAAIAANRGPYWAPEDEVFQQSISEEF